MPKPGKEGEYRVVGDFKPLNYRIEKMMYDINTPDQIWKKVDPTSEIYMVVDAHLKLQK